MHLVTPLMSLRWLVKSDGTRVLQQLHAVGPRSEWRDVPEVRE